MWNVIWIVIHKFFIGLTIQKGIEDSCKSTKNSPNLNLIMAHLQLREMIDKDSIGEWQKLWNLFLAENLL